MKPRLALMLFILPCYPLPVLFGYYARGTLSDMPGELQGKVFPGNATGGGRFVLTDSQGRLRCDGEMSPADIVAGARQLRAASRAGRVQCSDGRVMLVRWTAIPAVRFRVRAEDEARQLAEISC